VAHYWYNRENAGGSKWAKGPVPLAQRRRINLKAYILRIELEESNPLIWRKVIMPAGATYKRLHDVIQNVTNFQSGYPHEGYHLFEFDLTKDQRIVTDNEEAYLEHQHYKKNKAMYEERLNSMPVEMLDFEKKYQERLKIEVRKPTGLKR
jgi:uncharacterized protein YsxB (DUF464 family)